MFKEWDEKKKRNKKIMAMLKETPQIKIAKTLGVSRQRINQIIQRERAKKETLRKKRSVPPKIIWANLKE